MKEYLGYLNPCKVVSSNIEHGIEKKEFECFIDHLAIPYNQ